jgi:HEPN domain-containing protein
MASIDKYTQDAREWRMAAERTFEAGTLLFNHLNNPFLYFSAALLGHHALEMLLKSALIREGYPLEKGKTEEGCVWGHDLEKLAALLASKRPDFSLQIPLRLEIPLLSCKTYLGRYNAFFNELRYPGASPNVDSLGPGGEEAALLAELMDGIRPFAFPLPNEEHP